MLDLVDDSFKVVIVDMLKKLSEIYRKKLKGRFDDYELRKH